MNDKPDTSVVPCRDVGAAPNARLPASCADPIPMQDPSAKVVPTMSSDLADGNAPQPVGHPLHWRMIKVRRKGREDLILCRGSDGHAMLLEGPEIAGRVEVFFKDSSGTGEGERLEWAVRWVRQQIASHFSIDGEPDICFIPDWMDVAPGSFQNPTAFSFTEVATVKAQAPSVPSPAATLNAVGLMVKEVGAHANLDIIVHVAGDKQGSGKSLFVSHLRAVLEEAFGDGIVMGMTKRRQNDVGQDTEFFHVRALTSEEKRLPYMESLSHDERVKLNNHLLALGYPVPEKPTTF